MGVRHPQLTPAGRDPSPARHPTRGPRPAPFPLRGWPHFSCASRALRPAPRIVAALASFSTLIFGMASFCPTVDVDKSGQAGTSV